MLFVQEKPEGILFRIHVQPRSSKNQVVGLYGDALKVKLTAPPVEGAANKMCAEFLAKCLGVSKSGVEIVSGQTGRAKTVLLHYPGENPTRADRVRLKAAVAALAGSKG